MAETVRKNDFTQGSMMSNIIKMATPLTLALLVNVLYSVVDRVYIGHIPDVGADALTGIGIASPVILLISAFQALCSTGGAPLCSIARGKGDLDTAELYGLEILDSKINDERTNQTRFICISKTPAATVCANRMSLAFDLPNEPGELSNILAVFSDAGVNLTKILSRPIPTRPWEYTFFLDCIYTPNNKSLYGLLTHLRAEIPSVKLLGIYSEEEVK